MISKKGVCKKVLAALLAVAMLPAQAFADSRRVQAAVPVPSATGTQASLDGVTAGTPAVSYNADVTSLQYVTPVENQVETNYCWAYMANAVLESYLLKSGRTSPVDLSETHMFQQLNTNDSYGFSNLLSGGNYRQAVGYWTRGIHGGPVTESGQQLTDYYVSGTIELGVYDLYNQQEKKAYLRDIKNLVAQYGAVGVSVYFNANDRDQTTWNGAYYNPTGNVQVNHGVTIVGWDDNYAVGNFNNRSITPSQPSEPGAFLVKNNWGTNDVSSIGGNTGYYWISYENYFQDAFTVRSVIDRASLYSKGGQIAETDYRGLAEYGFGSSYTQVYPVASQNQMLTGIGTYVVAGASYHFYVNGQEVTFSRNDDGTSYSSRMTQSGYRTFRLDTPIELSTGTLELMVLVDSSQAAIPIAAGPDGLANSGNFCLKAFVRSQDTYDPSVSAVTINSDKYVTVGRGCKYQFTANVSGTNNPSQSVRWSVSGNSDRDTSISSTGELTVGCDEYGNSFTVTATSTRDASKSDFVTVTPYTAPGNVTMVTISPQTAYTAPGTSQTFTAHVYGTNNPADLLTWQVLGAGSANTAIVNGVLYVGRDETSPSITVQATSRLDTSKYATATVTVSGQQSCAITAVSGQGGVITPIGITTPSFGSSVTYTIYPNTGYMVADVLVDNVSVRSALISHGSGSNTYYSYTFYNINKPHRIEAKFVSAQSFVVTFVSDGQICKTELVPYGSAATPPVLTKEGHLLTWDNTSYGYVTSDLTINARWTPINGSGGAGSNINGSPNAGEDITPGGTEPSEPDKPAVDVVQVSTIDKGLYAFYENGSAIYTKNTGKSRSRVTVPASVKLGGVSYAVTKLDANCFRKNTKLVSVTVGSNITKIGRAAFYGCKKLKKIKIKSEVVVSIGNRAFDKIAKDAVIYVPRSCLEEYRSMIRDSGNTTARVRAYD